MSAWALQAASVELPKCAAFAQGTRDKGGESRQHSFYDSFAIKPNRS